LTRAERATIRQVLIGLAEDPAARSVLDRALVERFVPVNDGSYADIRRMCDRVQRAELLDASWHARWQAITDAGPDVQAAASPARA
jgi:hypothetical protein